MRCSVTSTCTKSSTSAVLIQLEANVYGALVVQQLELKLALDLSLLVSAVQGKQLSF